MTDEHAVPSGSRGSFERSDLVGSMGRSRGDGAGATDTDTVFVDAHSGEVISATYMQ
jgi:hypothetical protein